MRAVIAKPGALRIEDVPAPVPNPMQALVRVQTISLNRGEVRLALSDSPNARPGWDFAGVVEQAATSGLGPKVGTRVVGVRPSGAWAERLAVEPDWIAALPEQVSVAAASTLPVAGLTAYHALRHGGFLAGRRVLVNGASGGVGHFACQLAALSGAEVVATMRNAKHAQALEASGAALAAVVTSATEIGHHGPYDLALDSNSGAWLTAALASLKPDGLCVVYGITDAPTSSIDVRKFFYTGGGRLYGLAMFHELRRESASIGLGLLAKLVAQGKLKTHIELEAPIAEIGEIAHRMLDRTILGKAVLRF
ncbi:MAG: zinc-binding dehydrogenase [Burkholderiales bacterium]